MKILKTVPLSLDTGQSKTSVTLGTFDGVHIDHRHILHEVISRAKSAGETSLVLTFDSHPLSVLKSDFSPKLLTTLYEKLTVFEKIGIDITCIIPFTKEIAGLSTRHFIEDYLLKRFNMGTLIVGYDHGFGKKGGEARESFHDLSSLLNFSLKTVEPVEHDGIIVKSSTIRSLIADGDVEFASKLLETDYSLKGTVVEGNGLGKKIGIPTANVELENKEKIVPAGGVYAGWAEHEGKRLNAVVHIGPKPTFDIEKESIEAHLFEFSENLYGKKIRIGFIRKLRDISRFETQDELTNQIKIDIKTTKKIFEQR